MDESQRTALRNALARSRINPRRPGHTRLCDMLAHFCSAEAEDGRAGADVVLDRIVDIVARHVDGPPATDDRR